MIPSTVEQLLESGSPEAVEGVLEDVASVLLVDWRGRDEEIVRDCEEILKTGDLAAEVVEGERGDEMYIRHRGRRVKVPLVGGTGDRHVTVYTLGQVLGPEYEIRVCVDSNDSDTLAFVPLKAGEWAELEQRYGERVGERFRKVEERPNLFTERWVGGRIRGGGVMGWVWRFLGRKE